VNIIKTVLATTFATLLCGAAQAEDVSVQGVPTRSHAGQANYGFVVGGQWYVIPMAGFGYLMQASKVENAINAGLPISFLADTAQILTFHNGNTGPLAHDIDP
jgi:hypothetical protein